LLSGAMYTRHITAPTQQQQQQQQQQQLIQQPSAALRRVLNLSVTHICWQLGTAGGAQAERPKHLGRLIPFFQRIASHRRHQCDTVCRAQRRQLAAWRTHIVCTLESNLQTCCSMNERQAAVDAPPLHSPLDNFTLSMFPIAC
jgi:hypothetical protein